MGKTGVAARSSLRPFMYFSCFTGSAVGYRTTSFGGMDLHFPLRYPSGAFRYIRPYRETSRTAWDTNELD